MILAIETSGPFCSIGVLGHNIEFKAKTNARFQHAETLNVLLDITQELIPLDRIKTVALSLGPGYFTSLRAGAAAAKGLWIGLGIEIYGVNTLAAIAEDARDYPVACVLDAKKSQVYAAIFQGQQELLATGIYNVEQLMTKAGELGVKGFAGRGAVEHNMGEIIGPEEPDPLSLARIVRNGRGVKLDPARFEPLYIREPDAVVNLGK